MVESVGGVVEKEVIDEMGVGEIQKKYHEFMKKYEIGEAIKLVWSFIQRLDEYVEENKVYKLIKENQEDAKKRLGNLLGSVEIIAELIQPFLPETAEKMSLALKNPSERVHLFPRIE